MPVNILLTAGTYKLSQPTPGSGAADAGGDLKVTTNSLRIVGHAPIDTIIDGSDSALAGLPVFTVSNGTGLRLLNLTITGGQNSGIVTDAALAIDHVAVTGNKIVGGDGGGIHITNTGIGGAEINIVSSLIASNSASDTSGTGGNGGGISMTGLGGVSITASTISDNSATKDGGAIYLDKRILGVFNRVDITQNTAGNHSRGLFFTDSANIGGAAAPAFDLLAANDPSDTTDFDVSCATGAYGLNEEPNYSLIYNLAANCMWTAAGTGDQTLAGLGVGSSENFLDNSLQDNGGLTWTHALLAASGTPPLDNTPAPGNPPVDQREVPCTDSAAATGGADSALCDSGAFEIDPVQVNFSATPPTAAPPPQVGTAIDFDFPITHSAEAGLVDRGIGTSRVAFKIPTGVKVMSATPTPTYGATLTGRDCELSLDDPTSLLCIAGAIANVAGDVDLVLKADATWCGKVLDIKGTIVATSGAPQTATGSVQLAGPTLALVPDNTTVTEGSNVTLTATLDNVTGVDITNATLSYVVPSGVTLVSATASGVACDTTTVAGTATCTIADAATAGTVAAGASATATFVVTTTAVLPILNNSVSFASTSVPNCAPSALASFAITAAAGGASGGSSAGTTAGASAGSSGGAGTTTGGSTGNGATTPGSGTAKKCGCHEMGSGDVLIAFVIAAWLSPMRRRRF